MSIHNELGRGRVSKDSQDDLSSLVGHELSRGDSLPAKLQWRAARLFMAACVLLSGMAGILLLASAGASEPLGGLLPPVFALVTTFTGLVMLWRLPSQHGPAAPTWIQPPSSASPT